MSSQEIVDDHKEDIDDNTGSIAATDSVEDLSQALNEGSLHNTQDDKCAKQDSGISSQEMLPSVEMESSQKDSTDTFSFESGMEDNKKEENSMCLELTSDVQVPLNDKPPPNLLRSISLDASTNTVIFCFIVMYNAKIYVQHRIISGYPVNVS